MVATPLNLYFEQGNTNTRSFAFIWDLVLVCGAIGTSATPITQLEIEPLPVDIPSGFELHFSCEKKLTTNLLTTAGSSFVSIIGYVGKLSKGERCNAPAVDLSEGVYTCDIRDKNGGNIIANPTVVGALGFLSINIPDTPVIPYNVRRSALPNGDPQVVVQDESLMGSLYKKGFPYQVDRLHNAVKSRIFEGFVFVGGRTASA